VIASIRLLKDSNGRYVWTDGFADAAPTLLGRPVIEQNDIRTNLGAGTNASEIYFGDLSYYLIGDRQEIGVETTTVNAGAFEDH
jgi:HK97 family phage major capsid protein